jgi:YfiH family protein
VLVADCVPVVLADPGRAVAVAHAGRGGVVAGVVGETVATMAPADPARVEAVIGPAIGGCCYEVDAELAAAVAAEVPASRATTSWGTPALDLPAAVATQLRAAGLDRITRVGGCTRCAPSRWFSHRRAPGEGRQAGVVVRAAGGPGAGGGERHA